MDPVEVDLIARTIKNNEDIEQRMHNLIVRMQSLEKNIYDLKKENLMLREKLSKAESLARDLISQLNRTGVSGWTEPS